MKKYELIDFLKGFAILTIVIYHALLRIDLNPMMHNAIKLGGTGVHLFLLISGLGLYLSHKRKALSFPVFLKKRFSKIYLPYILIVIISASLGLLWPLFEINSWYAFGGHVLLYKMFDNHIIGSYGYQLWFLSTILQFYLLFHVLAWVKSRSKNRYFLLIGLLISFAWGSLILALGFSNLRNWNSFFLQYLWEFMLGMVFASLLLQNRLHLKLKAFHFLAIGVFMLAIFAYLALKGGDIGRIFNDFPALIGYSSLAIFIYLLKIKPLNTFILYTGKISFALYLVHMLIMNIVSLIFKNVGWEIGYLSISLSIILSYLIAHYYQKFILMIYKKLGI